MGDVFGMTLRRVISLKAQEQHQLCDSCGLALPDN